MNQRSAPTAKERRLPSRTRAWINTGDQPARRRHPSNTQKTSRKHAYGGVIPTTLYHAGNLLNGVVTSGRKICLTPKLSFAQLHQTTSTGRVIFTFKVPNSRLKEWSLPVGIDDYKGTTGPVITVPAELAPELNHYMQ